MADSKDFRTGICAILARHTGRALALFVSGAMLASSAAVRAAPVTLAFEATIDTVFPGIPFDSGIDFATGDVISGTFTFEPALGDGSMVFRSTQPYGFSFYIGGFFLGTPSFEIESINNLIRVYDCPDSSCFPPAGVYDSLRVGGAFGPDDPASLPNIDADRSSFTMEVLGPASSFQMARYPADVANWNAFDLRRQLSVAFRNGVGGAIGFQATVGAFVALPEPSSCRIALLLAIVAFLNLRKPVLSAINKGHNNAVAYEGASH